MKKLIAVLLFLLMVSQFNLLAQEENVVQENNEAENLQDPYKFVFKGGASMKLYGAMDMVTYYDTTSVYVSDWYIFVYPNNTYNGQEDSFSMAVRASKLGLALNYPKALLGGDVNAKVEADFVGGFLTGSMSVYSPLLRLKQAYVSWDTKQHSFLLGQTFAHFLPLFPATGTWIALGASGNPWMRLPQIKYTYRNSGFKFEASATRPMGANMTTTDSVNDIINDGEQSNMPFFIGRAGYDMSWLSTGVSGVYGREKIHRDDDTTTPVTAVDVTLPVWLAGYDLKLSSKYVDFLGEFFYGENINSFFAGVIQGVNTTATDATVITTHGYWGQLTLKPGNKLNFHFGAGIDNPDNGDLTATQRSYNFTAFGNANYKLTNNWTLSLEVPYMKTGYVNGTDNDNIRAMFRTVFSF
ncbi:MAG: hypothetical protein ABIA04_15885 [Pseudomonadota bacterium]